MNSINIEGVIDEEGDDIIIEVIDIKQDAPINGCGDGDSEASDTLNPLKIRAERSGNLY